VIGGQIWIRYVFVPGQPFVSVAEKVTFTPVPLAVVGVPVTAPVLVFSASPAGSVPQPIPRPIPGALSAHLAGASSLIADLTGVDRDAEAVLLLLDLDLMLTEGVLA
jgi:hypothetical protein